MDGRSAKEREGGNEKNNNDKSNFGNFWGGTFRKRLTKRVPLCRRTQRVYFSSVSDEESLFSHEQLSSVCILLEFL